MATPFPNATGASEVEQLADAIAERVVERLAARDDRPLLTIEQLADRLQIKRRTAQELIYPVESARIPSFTVAGGSRRISPAAVDQYVAEQRAASS